MISEVGNFAGNWIPLVFLHDWNVSIKSEENDTGIDINAWFSQKVINYGKEKIRIINVYTNCFIESSLFWKLHVSVNLHNIPCIDNFVWIDPNNYA